MRALTQDVMALGAAGVMIAPPNTLRTDDSIVQYYKQASEAIGADVPFALKGGTAVGTGRGDVLNPALARGRFDWVLVTSDETPPPCTTPCTAPVTTSTTTLTKASRE